ncbi:hypothetical protein ACHAPI_006368 [Fusarium lateritium]
MRCNSTRLAVAISLLLTAQSAQAGPMWTGKMYATTQTISSVPGPNSSNREKRQPVAFLDVRMENSQAPTAAHDGYGSGDGDQTTPRPVFETLNSTPEPNPLLSDSQGDEKKKNPYSEPVEPVEVIPIQPTSQVPEPTSQAPQKPTEEPVEKPTFTQNPSAPIITTSIGPKDPTSEAEKPTSVVDTPQYDAPVDSAVVTETGSVTKEIPTAVNGVPTSEPVEEVTSAVPEVPTTEVAQKPENTDVQSLSSTLDLGTLQPTDGEKTKPSAVEETTAPEVPSSPATVPGQEQPATTAVEDETTSVANEPTLSVPLTTQAPADTSFPINPKHPSNIYPNPRTTSAGDAQGTSAVETDPAAGTTETVSVVEPKDPQPETTSDVQPPPAPAPTSEAAQPENPIPVSEPAQPNNPALTSEVKQSYAPVETPSAQQPDTPAATTAPAQPPVPAQPQNPVPTSHPVQPSNPTTSAAQQPAAPVDTSAVQQPAPVPTNAQPNYPAPVPDQNTQPAAPPSQPASSVVVSDPSLPETTSAPQVVPTGTSANGVPTIKTGAPTGTSAIPAAAYASNVVDARTYNEEFAKLTPESSCMKGQAACINGQTAVCDDSSAFKLTPCTAQGEKCFALPLYNFEGGIKIVCEDPATAAKILGGSPNSGEDNTVPGNADKDKQPVTTSAAEKQPEAPVVTVTTIVTVDDGEAPEPTSQPAQEQPVQPTEPAGQPSQPAVGQPSQPAYQQPSQPQPVPEPTLSAPEQTSQPQPVPEQPTQPATEQPSQPAPEQSTQPAQNQPSQPAPEQPSQPIQTQPAQEQPSQPAEKEPTETHSKPTKAYEDLPPTPPPATEQTTSVALPGGTTLTKSIKKPDEAEPTASPDDGGDGNKDKDGDDKPTSVELIPIPDKPTDAPAPKATEAKVESGGDSKPVASTRTGDDAHATTIVVDGTPTVSVYFTVTVTDKNQATVTVTEKEKETVTLVISA